MAQLPTRQGVDFGLNCWYILSDVVADQAVPHCWLAALLHYVLLMWDILDYLCYFRVAEGILEEGEVVLQGFDL